MRLLLTGAAGYSGVGLAGVLSERHWVRGADLRPGGPEVAESVVADITDLEACRRAVDGVDAVVMCHMAPNPKGYATPVMAVDINVKGTANLFHVMAEKQIRRAVLISTTGTLTTLGAGAAGGAGGNVPALPGFGPYNLGQAGKQGLYGLTKVMQELIARYYFQTAGIITTLLRPGWVVYDERLVTKYGEKMETYYPSLVDPRDMGRAVLLALELPAPTLEAFELAQDDSPSDLTPTHTRLNWRPVHRFATLRKP